MLLGIIFRRLQKRYFYVSFLNLEELFVIIPCKEEIFNTCILQIDMGTELAYQFGSQVPGGHIAVHSLAARYNGN